jgi:Arc/MetJ-type ribon-helix-helix transcriptional regulator
MPQIAIRLTEDELAGLDRLVAERHFASRAAAIREALAKLQKAEEDRQIAEEYRRAYEKQPVTQEEIDLGHLGAYLMGKLTENEPPWVFGGEEEPAAKPDIAFALQKIEVVAERLLALVHTAAEQQRQAT